MIVSVNSSARAQSRFHARNPLYRTYYGMLQRCYNPRTENYKLYGARGISVCDRWRNSFQAFVNDMGERPSRHHTLDRINVDGNYTPENCRWATWQQQCCNKRNNTVITYQGHAMALADAVRAAGNLVDYDYACVRIKRGWPLEKAIETKPRGRHCPS